MEIDWATIITAIVGAVGGGGLTSLFFMKEDKKKKTLENDAQASTAWRELYERSDKESEELKAEINELRKEVNRLMQQNTELAVKNSAYRLQKCEVVGCDKRKPPRDF